MNSIRSRKLQKNKKVIFLSFFIFSIGAGLLCYVRCITSIGEKMVKQCIKEMGNTMQLKAHVNSFFETKRITEDVWLSHNYIAGIYNTNTIFAQLSDLLWIYPVYMNGQSLDPAVALAVNATKAQGY